MPKSRSLIRRCQNVKWLNCKRAAPVRNGAVLFHSSSSSSWNRGDRLRRKYRMPPRQATHTTRHIAMPTTSITRFSVRFRVLRRHNKPLRRGGNHHQQSRDCRTVGVPIRPKHKIPGLITIMEDRKQDRMPIKGRGIDDGKKKEGGENRGTNNRGEKMRANQLD